MYLVLKRERGINPLWVDNPNYLQAVPGKSEIYSIRQFVFVRSFFFSPRAILRCWVIVISPLFSYSMLHRQRLHILDAVTLNYLYVIFLLFVLDSSPILLFSNIGIHNLVT